MNGSFSRKWYISCPRLWYFLTKVSQQLQVHNNFTIILDLILYNMVFFVLVLSIWELNKKYIFVTESKNPCVSASNQPEINCS